MTQTAPTPVGPYSPVRKAGDFYFVSGCIGMDSVSKIAPEDIASQTAIAIRNLETALKSANLTLADVVKTTIFLTNMGDFTAVNEVYSECFSPPRPARSAVAVSELPRVANLPLKVEIEAVAYSSSVS